MSTSELFRLLLSLIRKGTVSAVDHDKETCRVAIGDLESNWIRWQSLAAGDTTDWNPPTVGEQVIVLSPGGELADGIVLRGITTDEKPAPSHKPSAHTRKYPDGAVVEYDHATHALAVTLPAGATVLLQAPGSVTVTTAGAATVEADQVTVKAATGITLDTPNVTCTNELTVNGIKFTKHVHAETGSKTREPQ